MVFPKRQLWRTNRFARGIFEMDATSDRTLAAGFQEMEGDRNRSGLRPNTRQQGANQRDDRERKLSRCHAS
jgi:hypothetical protein